jgi:hypothetical protein
LVQHFPLVDNFHGRQIARECSFTSNSKLLELAVLFWSWFDDNFLYRFFDFWWHILLYICIILSLEHLIQELWLSLMDLAVVFKTNSVECALNIVHEY